MGNCCRIQSGVVIGNTANSGENKPEVGDHVSFDLGCKVYGKITIGNNVRVLPNAVVCKDVPSNLIIGGIPSRNFKNIELIVNK